MERWRRPPDASYPVQIVFAVQDTLQRLLSAPSHSRRAEAARRQARRSLMLFAGAAVVVMVLMIMVDAATIQLMPPRGTPSLWPFRILTDFGKSSYVLWALAAAMLAALLVLPLLRKRARAVMAAFGDRVLFLFLAVAFPVLVGDVLKGLIGRGRPFVGGHANPFNFSPLAFTEKYASFPSGHAITSAALAFAVAAVWPRTRWWMVGYVIAILLSRLVLLAHHPSDVVGGALVGVLGAMVVQYWFAARHQVFIITADGTVRPRRGPSLGDLKKVARSGFAPYEAQSAKRD